MNFYKTYQKLLDLIFPIKCIKCGQTGKYICQDCKKQLQVHPEICPICHKPSKNFKVCIKCQKQKNKKPIRGIIIGFKYNKLIKTLILKLKYYHKRDISKFLAKRLSYILKSHPHINLKNTILTYVPSHWWRKYFIKGYNQSKLLAKQMSRQLDIDCLKLTKKHKKNKSQTELDREQRILNLNGSFKPLKINQKINGNNIIIVDDITTTGSTILQVAKNLKPLYPKSHIRGLVVGRHI